MTCDTLVTTVSIRHDGDYEVCFPVHQPGASGLIGYLTTPAGAHVLKLLKVPDLRAWSFGGARVTEPAYVRLLRKAPLRGNAYAPTRQMRDRLITNNDLCCTWLRRVGREQARESLAQAVPAADPGPLLDELFGEHDGIDFVPKVSAVVDVDFPSPGPRDVPALLQSQAGGEAFRLPLRHRDSQQTQRWAQLRFLLLLTLALRLAWEQALGLDLAPRLSGPALRFPNVLASSESGEMAYVDFFGLASARGNAMDRAGYWLGYGGRFPVATLAQRLARQLAAPKRSGVTGRRA